MLPQIRDVVNHIAGGQARPVGPMADGRANWSFELLPEGGDGLAPGCGGGVGETAPEPPIGCVCAICCGVPRPFIICDQSTCPVCPSWARTWLSILGSNIGGRCPWAWACFRKARTLSARRSVSADVVISCPPIAKAIVGETSGQNHLAQVS